MTIAGIPLQTLLAAPIAILAFVVLLSIIVFIHEYGHFATARALGVKVDVFSIGFGKPIARWTDRHGTEWRIALLPLGGYVKFFGDASPASNPSKAVAEPHPATTQFPAPGHEEEIGRGMTPEQRAKALTEIVNATAPTAGIPPDQRGVQHFGGFGQEHHAAAPHNCSAACAAAISLNS